MGVKQLAEEKEVIDRVLSGDRHAYRKLVDHYKDYAVTLAFRVMKEHDAAEEVAQLAFIKAYQSLEYFRKTARFSSWLYRIIYNTAISELRKKKYHEPFRTEKFDMGTAVNTHPMEAKDRRRFIDIALHKLPEQDALLLNLYYLEEMSLEEISQETGMQVNTAKVRLHRARKKIADKLKNILKEETVTL